MYEGGAFRVGFFVLLVRFWGVWPDRMSVFKQHETLVIQNETQGAAHARDLIGELPASSVA